MEFILVCTIGILFLFCCAVLIDWIIYRLRDSFWWRPSSWQRHLRSWSYARAVRGLTIRSQPGRAPSLGKLRSTRSRAESLNGKEN